MAGVKGTYDFNFYDFQARTNSESRDHCEVHSALRDEIEDHPYGSLFERGQETQLRQLCRTLGTALASV
jgi:hypothetical protein